MSDPISTARVSLAEAMRALPLATPDRDGWPALAARFAVPAAPRRLNLALPLALAAACVLAVLVAATMRPATPPTNAQAATVSLAPASLEGNSANVNKSNMGNASIAQVQSTDDAPLAAAQLRSQALERWLRDTGAAASPLRGQDLAAAAEIENLIGFVDVELAAPRQTDALPLWQRRVALLEDLTTLRYSNYRLTESSLADASNRIN
jgi:hypothetical protein